ncbi:MAG TPA: hypothetical protein VMS86_09985 [Thermoanaerobaculia bacterium]|nr:hypothetical protein [Thermoanaerobaculia bacterium]
MRLLIAAGIAAALAAHVSFWYLPRERGAAVEPTSPAGELLVGGSQAVRLWVAYPHQNLGVAARAMDDPAAAIAAASRRSGLGEVELPAFGPFALPPSRALSVAVDPGGENVAVTIEVFPAVALLARVAGTVAGNPILRGGPVVVSGREMSVSWRGRAWSLHAQPGPGAPPSPPLGAPSPPAAGTSAGEGLAFLALASPQGALAPGMYRLRREETDLVLGSHHGGRWSAAARLVESRAREHDLAFLGLRREEPAATTVLVLPRTARRGLELPDAAVAWTGDVERWDLPGERVLRLLGLDPLEARVDSWSLLAIERPSLEAAARLAPELGRVAAEAGVSLQVWIRPRDYLPLVAAIAEVLDRLPIAPEAEVERWRDLETLLEAAGPVERVSITVGAGGAEARLGWAARGFDSRPSDR